MENRQIEILSVADLKIGFFSGGVKKILTSPLNATASKGELIALIGHNGVGKSTLLRTVMGLQTLLGGNVFINKKNLNSYNRTEIAKKAGFISTENITVGNMNVYDLVALGRYPHTNWLGKIEEEDNEIIMDSINKVGMFPFANKHVAELSDGERQRAMIARVLAQDTALLLMDEPTAFLDIRNKFEIVHLMHSLTRDRKKTIIFSTHDLQTAINEADKIWLVLEDGIVEGSPEDLILNGSFESLFSDSRLKFNNSEGSFGISKDHLKSINVEGEGLTKHWTEKALNRIGYSTSDSKSDNCICIIKQGDITKWQLLINESKMEFFSIYDLVVWLSSNTL